MDYESGRRHDGAEPDRAAPYYLQSPAPGSVRLAASAPGGGSLSSYQYSDAETARQIEMAPALFRRAVFCGRKASDFAVRSINRAVIAEETKK